MKKATISVEIVAFLFSLGYEKLSTQFLFALRYF